MENKEELPFCECGECGLRVTKSGNRYIVGHNNRGKVLNKSETRTASRKKWWDNLSDEERKEIGKKISGTKNSPEGKRKAKLGRQKCRAKLSIKLKGRIPPNKMDDSQKILVKCLNCDKEELYVPSVAKTRKFCCRDCEYKYRTGRPHENWNPNSFHKMFGRGIAGRYKEILFRSSYELSFIYRAFQLGDIVVAEPFRIKVYDYLNSFTRSVYNVRKNKLYVPDYLLNKKTVVEIKCSIVFDLEHPSFTDTILKLDALACFCKENDYDYVVLTEEEMGELILTDKQIKSIPKSDIEFFKQRHKEKYLTA